MPNMWVLTNGANSPSVGARLNGCKIKQTPDAFEFYLQNGSDWVVKIYVTSLPITFQGFTVGGQTWDITVNTLPSATNAGRWVTPSQIEARPEDVPPTSGEFTAQVGGTFAEESAASAGQGKH